jgi:hypothetical protein
LPPGPAQLNE